MTIMTIYIYNITNYTSTTTIIVLTIITYDVISSITMWTAGQGSTAAAGCSHYYCPA